MSDGDLVADDRPSSAPAAALGATDWVVRLFSGPGRTTARVAFLLLLLFVAGSWAFRLGVEGHSVREFVRDPYTYLDVLNSLLFVYLAVALHLLRIGRVRDLEALRPVLAPGGAGIPSLVAEVVDAPPGRLFRGGIVGAILVGSMPVLDPGFWEGNRPELFSAEMLFFALRSAATGWLVGHVMVTEARAVRGFRRLGREELRVDLFDLEPLAPIARAGFRSALSWVLASSLVSLFWLGPAAGRSNAFIVGAVLMLVIVLLFVSLSGVHENIRRTKQRALEALREAIRARGGALLRGAADAGGPSVADLVALHGFVERVREWPLGAPAAARGGLIVLVALGSWGGAALVELLIDRALAG